MDWENDRSGPNVSEVLKKYSSDFRLSLYIYIYPLPDLTDSLLQPDSYHPRHLGSDHLGLDKLSLERRQEVGVQIGEVTSSQAQAGHFRHFPHQETSVGKHLPPGPYRATLQISSYGKPSIKEKNEWKFPLKIES